MSWPMKITQQYCKVNSLLLPLHGFSVQNSACQATFIPEPPHQPNTICFHVKFHLFYCWCMGKHFTFAYQPYIIHYHLLVTGKFFINSLGFSTLITLTSMSKDNCISYLANYIHFLSLPYYFLFLHTYMCMCLYVGMYIWMQVPVETRRRHQIPQRC